MKKLIPLCIVLISAVVLSIPTWAVDEEVTHTVKKGDTLWDISNAYFKTPWKWPLVWANNQDIITNPHKIYPGEIVVLKNRDGKIEVKIIPAETMVGQPETAEEKVLTIEQVAQEEEKSILVAPNYSSFIYSDTPIKGKGTFIQKKEIGALATVDDIIYCRMDEATSSKNLSVVTKVMDINQGKQTIGYLYKVSGLVSVLENKDNLIRAKITHAVQEINLGDVVTDELTVKPMDVKINQLGSLSEGTIVDTYGGDNVGIATSGLIFTNMGASQGLQKGTLVNIQKIIQVTGGGSMPEYLGMAMVIQTLENSSMALVVDAVEPIEKGHQVSTK